MASMQSASTVAFISPTARATYKNSAGKGNLPIEPGTYLTSILHSTLELDEVLKIFFEETQQTIPCDSMSYNNDAKNTMLTYGSQSQHQCDYRIFTEQDFLGELYFTRSTHFDEKELKEFEKLIGYLVPSLRNALLYRDAVQAALKDPLTGAGNRLALDNTLRRELQLAHRHDSPFSILMIDIDNFKQVNDTHGHQVGDEVLRGVAESIVTVTRQTDMLFRYGGEEFLVILSKTNAEGARVIAERVRYFIEKNNIISDQDSAVTVSIGSSTLASGEHPDQLIGRADQALYEAKTRGKNCVVCSDLDLSKTTSMMPL